MNIFIFLVILLINCIFSSAGASLFKFNVLVSGCTFWCFCISMFTCNKIRN